MHHKVYDYYLKALPETEMERFEIHLLHCQSCQEKIDRLDRAFIEMRQDQAYYRELRDRIAMAQKRVRSTRRMVRYAMAALFLFIIGSGLFAYLTRPAYFELAKLSDETKLITLKSDFATGDFENALQQFRSKNYQAAISGFKKVLIVRPSDYHAHYFMGLANLAAGETNFLWYHRFPEHYTRESIFYLQQTEKLTNDNQFYQEACLWLLGKAWLRLGNREQAKLAWQKIQSLPSPDLIYKKHVREMLEKLE